jgi:hypothetical protein
MKKQCLAVVALMAVSASVFASPMNMENFYASLGAGYASPEKMPSFPSIDRDLGSAAGRAAIGYQYNASIPMGVELGYSYLGKLAKYTAEGVDAGLKYYTLDALVTASYPMSQFFLTAKGGMAYEHVSGTGDLSGSSDHKYVPEVGLAAGYHINQNLALDLSVYHTFGENLSDVSDPDDSHGTPSIDSAFLSLSFSA